MRNFKFGMVAACLLLASAGSIAQTKIVIKERPVTLIQQGDIWMVPEGSTSSYYSYTVGSDQYICTRTEPSDLAGVKFVSLNLKMGTNSESVRCYPVSYFDVQ